MSNSTKKNKHKKTVQQNHPVQQAKKVEHVQKQSIVADADIDIKIQRQLDELAAMPAPKKRIWEIDFLRGLLILFVVFDHFMSNFVVIGSLHFKTDFWGNIYREAIGYFANSESPYQTIMGRLRTLTHDSYVYLFVLASGISSGFSRSNLKRGVRMTIFALLFTAFTYAVGSVIDERVQIAYNIIHVVASCVLIYSLTEFILKYCKKHWQKNLYGVLMVTAITVMLIAGHYYREFPKTTIDLSVIFIQNNEWRKNFADYWPLFPSLGWFFIGAFLGKRIYKEKTTLFPSVKEKWLYPITFIGKHSLWFYFGTQIVMFGLTYFFAVILGVM